MFFYDIVTYNILGNEKRNRTIKFEIGGNKMEQLYEIGDIVETKKQHPCGSKLWKITRVGVDFKLECQGCGHVVMIERPKALKMIKKKIEK